MRGVAKDSASSAPCPPECVGTKARSSRQQDQRFTIMMDEDPDLVLPPGLQSHSCSGCNLHLFQVLETCGAVLPVDTLFLRMQCS